MKKFLIILVSIFLFSACLHHLFDDEYVVVDKHIQDPISVFEVSDDKPDGYIKNIPRLYIITIKNISTGEKETIQVDKSVYFKYNLGSEMSDELVDKYR